MKNLLDNLKNLLQKDERLISEGELLKNKVIELAIKLDESLIELLLSDERMREVFFKQVGKATIFDKDKFICPASVENGARLREDSYKDKEARPWQGREEGSRPRRRSGC